MSGLGNLGLLVGAWTAAIPASTLRGTHTHQLAFCGIFLALLKTLLNFWLVGSGTDGNVLPIGLTLIIHMHMVPATLPTTTALPPIGGGGRLGLVSTNGALGLTHKDKGGRESFGGLFLVRMWVCWSSVK